MAKTGDCTELRNTLSKRYEVLTALATKPRTKPQLVEAVDPSRSTIDRAISALEDADCIEQIDGNYHLTQAGRICLSEHNRYRETINGVCESKEVLNSISQDAHIDPVFLNGVDVHVADPFAPESALEPSITQLESANRLLGLAPVVLSIYTDVLTTLVNKNGLQTEFILPDGLLDSIDDNYAHRFTATDMPDHFDFYVTEHELPYALWIMEFDDRVTAGMTVHENGGVRGVLMNDSPEAVRWAREEYAQYREQARYVTLDLTV